MNATAKLRRRAGQRVSSALWGLLVMGSGALMIATLSGYDIDMQLIAIIGLGALGAWLLISAAVSGWGRQKQIAQATAPVVEEPAMSEAAEPASETREPDTSEAPAKPKTPATTTASAKPGPKKSAAKGAAKQSATKRAVKDSKPEATSTSADDARSADDAKPSADKPTKD